MAVKRSFENILKRAVYLVGTNIERLINSAKRVKTGVALKGGMQPILSLESQLPEQKISELILHASTVLLDQMIPNLKEMSGLEMADGNPIFSTQFMRMSASRTVFCEIGNQNPAQGDLSTGFVMRADPSSLPFDDASFDYFIARLATPLQGDLARGIAELSRVMTAGGQGVLLDFHPYSLFAKDGSQRMRSLRSIIRGIEDYYKICKKSGLRIVNLKEYFIDEMSRSFFAPDLIPIYRNLKGSPLLIALFVYKPRGKTVIGKEGI